MATRTPRSVDASKTASNTAAMSPSSVEAGSQNATRPLGVVALAVEPVLWLVVLMVAAAFRLAALGAAPLTRAEGGLALQTWQVAHGRVVDGWPGSTVDALTAVLFRLFGSADALARLLPVVAGLLLVGSIYLLRPYLGRTAALLAACLAAISPILTYDARSTDGQAVGAALAIVTVVLVLHLLEQPSPRRLILIFGALALGLATNAVFLGTLLCLAAWLLLQPFWQGEGEGRAMPWRSAVRLLTQIDLWWRGAVPLTLAAALLAVSRFGVGFARLRPAATASWALAFEPSRPDVPWHYVLDVLVGYEAPLLVLGAIGVWLVLRTDSWRTRPVDGLLLIWLAGGAIMAIFMAGRLPGTLLLVVVPLCLAGGRALATMMERRWQGTYEPIDVVLASGLAFAVIYVLITAASIGASTATLPLKLWGGLLLAVLCLTGTVLRARQAGMAVAWPAAAVLVITGVFVALHSTSAVAFGPGDEYLIGQRTTQEGVAQAALLVTNNGGVASVTEEALPPLSWYLRDTIRSGGHGGASLLGAKAALPAGFHFGSDASLVSRTWSPRSWNGAGMIRWWMYREAWEPAREVTTRLAVED